MADSVPEPGHHAQPLRAPDGADTPHSDAPRAASTTVVVSLRSRGLGSFDLSKFDIPGQAIRLSETCLDIFLSFLLTWYEMSWSAWLSMVIAIIAAAVSMSSAWLDVRPTFNVRSGDSPRTLKTSGSVCMIYHLPVLITILSPVAILLCMVLYRREEALRALAEVKSTSVGMCLSCASLGAPADYTKDDDAPQAYADRDASLAARTRALGARQRGGKSRVRAVTAAPGSAAGATGTGGGAGSTSKDQHNAPSATPSTGSDSGRSSGSGLSGGSASAADADAPQLPPDMTATVVAMLDELHRYLHHKRPYVRHLYLPYKTSQGSGALPPGLLSTSQEMGLLLRQVLRSVRALHEAVGALRASGVAAPEHADRLAAQVVELHTSVEVLAAIKEYHTPMTMRTTARWAVLIITPVFMSFVADVVRMLTSLPMLGVVTSMFVQLTATSMLDLVDRMEDPFDDTVLDTPSVLEAVMHVVAMVRPSSLEREEFSVEEMAAAGKVAVPGGAAGAGGSGAVQGSPRAPGRPPTVHMSVSAAGTSPQRRPNPQQQQDVPASAVADAHTNFVPPPMPPIAGGGYSTLMLHSSR